MTHLVRSFAAAFPDGHHIPAHAHGWGQLIYAGSGVMRVRAGDTLWLVPPAQAVWAPAGVRHEIWARGDFAMRTLYFAPDFSAALPSECRALEVSPLLRELVLEVVRLQALDEAEPAQKRLAEVVADLVAAADVLPASLPMPRDPRATKLAERLKDEPSCEAELEALSRDAGASARTMQRLFLEETGLRFSEWRQRLRLIHAASVLGDGVSVTEAGLQAGYASTSAFIAAFRKRFGRTPARMKEGAPADERRVASASGPGGTSARLEPSSAIQGAPQGQGAITMKARIGFALLGVTDLERSIAFYRDLLGWPLVDQNSAEGYARLDAGGIGVKLLSGHAPMIPPHPVLEVVVDDLDGAYAELSARGVIFSMPPTLMPWGGVLSQFQDPDGHPLYLCPAA